MRNHLHLKYMLAMGMLLTTMLTASAEVYYGLFPSKECSDAIREMKTQDETNVAHWQFDGTVTPNSIIGLRNADSKLKPAIQEMMELSNEQPVQCKTPVRTFRMTKPMSITDIGFGNCDTLQRLNLWLTFKPNGAPDTLFIGVKPGSQHMFSFLTPSIRVTKGAASDGTFVKGTALAFEANCPEGYNDMLFWEWYVDGVFMSGRNDRWFESYSRTNWENGPHEISVRYKKKNGKRYSDYARLTIVQHSTKEKSVRVFPYWGADCTDEENLDSTMFTFNPKAKWGSFVIHPLQDYVHFYTEWLNERILTSTITNDGSVQNFELLEPGDAGSQYAFFDLPTNCKAHAKEPFSPVTVYFRINGTNINYSLLPYITPQVTATPDSVEICENSFETVTKAAQLSAKASGFFTADDYKIQWLYCEKINGLYEPVEKGEGHTLLPARTGYYKAQATDGVFFAISNPVKVVQRTQNCLSAEIYSTEGKDYTCPNGTLELHTTLTAPDYEYQWKTGDLKGNKLKNIEGATSDIFYGSVSKPGEGYYIEVRQGNRSVISRPFRVRELPKFNRLTPHTLVTESTPKEVCPDYNVTIKARVEGRKADSLPLIYNFYQDKLPQPVLLGTVESTDENVYFSTPVHASGSTYYVVALSCDQQLQSPKNMTADLRTDEHCGTGDFYVKKSGDNFSDGTSWKTAFATIGQAIKAVKDLRKSSLYASKPVSIHIAAGTYQPDEAGGFDFPSNTTIYGGYDELPTDKTISGIQRNPVTPANPNGFATIFRSDSAQQRIVCLTDRSAVKIVGINFVGENMTTSINGRGLTVNNSEVTLDSCWFTGFKSSPSAQSPVTAVAVIKTNDAKRNDLTPALNIMRTTFSQNTGGEWGACVVALCDANVNIEQSTFNHNTNRFKGGTAFLSYNVSPKVTIKNSTFYSNTVTSGAGNHGSSVLRMAGGKPICNIYSSTICDHFYKENGVLNIYNSIVECAGNATVYENNYPRRSSFVEGKKDDPYNNNRFGANFKGNRLNKIKTVEGSITQMLIPGNVLEIINQGGAPNPNAITDQRGVERNPIASTYGAYEPDNAVAIVEKTGATCINNETKTSFMAAVTGVKNAKYQWVNNYSDIAGANTLELNDVGLGTYWLEVTGRNDRGAKVSLKSNEIRVSDVCETPGEIYVNAEDGRNNYSGTTWSKAVGTIERALMIAKQQYDRNPKEAIVINVAEGTYTPSSPSGFRIEQIAKDIPNITIRGGFSKRAIKGDACQPKLHSTAGGHETVFTPKGAKGALFALTSATKGLKIVGIHFKGQPKMITQGGAISANGAQLTVDSCWFSDFTDASVTKGGNNSVIDISATSQVNISNCHFNGNRARGNAGVGIRGAGNRSRVNIHNTTFNGNMSTERGGAAISITEGAAPAINVMNCTFFSNRTTNTACNAFSTIRMNGGGETRIDIYNSSLLGTSMVENGKMSLTNTLMEATGGNYTATNSFVAYDRLINGNDDISLSSHRRFADAFRYALTLDCGLVPTILLNKGSDDEITRKVPTLTTPIDGFDLGNDQCGNPRAAESNMGASQMEE